MFRTRALAPRPLVAAVAAALVLTACADDSDSSFENDEPSPETTDSASSTSSDPPTETTADGPSDPITASCGEGEAASWTPLLEPGNGGWVTEVEFSPHDPEVLLTGGDVMGLARSADGGHTWRHVTGLLSGEIAKVTWHPNDPDVVWVGTLSGPHVSRDGGQTWEPARTGLPPVSEFEYSAPIEVVVFDPDDDDHLLAFGGNRRESVRGGPPGLPGAPAWGVVWESRDGGTTWQWLSEVSPGGVVTDAVYLESGVLLASVDERGLLRSDDGGVAWYQVGGGLTNPNVRDIEVAPSATSVWVAVEAAVINGQLTVGGLFQSLDGGLTFSPVDTGAAVSVGSTFEDTTGYRAVAAAPSNPSIMYTSNVGWRQQAVFRSADGGSTWSQVADPSGSDVGRRFYSSPPIANAITISSTDPGLVALAGSEYILMTEDGTTWWDATAVPLDAGTTGTGFSGLVSSHALFGRDNPDLMILTAFDGANVLVSRDDATTWTRPLASARQYGGGDSIAEGPNGQLAVLLGQIGNFAGIALSSDGGATWQYRVGGSVGLPEDAALLRLGGITYAGEAIIAAIGPTAYRSTDGGQTWVGNSLPTEFTSLATTSSGIVYAASNQGLFVSSDGGASYAPAGGGPLVITRIRPDPFDDNAVYATSWRSSPEQSGLWRFDGSGGWARLIDDFYAFDVAIDPTTPGRLALATTDPPFHDETGSTGVSCTLDGGGTWMSIGGGLPLSRVRTVAFDPHHPGRLVAGTDGAGFTEIILDEG